MHYHYNAVILQLKSKNDFEFNFNSNCFLVIFLVHLLISFGLRGMLALYKYCDGTAVIVCDFVFEFGSRSPQSYSMILYLVWKASLQYREAFCESISLFHDITSSCLAITHIATLRKVTMPKPMWCVLHDKEVEAITCFTRVCQIMTLGSYP